MGMGLYNLLGYGVLDPNWPTGWDEITDLEAALDDIGIQITSESTPFYVVVPLAVDSDVLQRWWDLPPLPDEVLRCAPRRARYADEVIFPLPEAAQTCWQQAQASYAAQGLILGEAKLIMLNDWD